MMVHMEKSVNQGGKLHRTKAVLGGKKTKLH